MDPAWLEHLLTRHPLLPVLPLTDEVLFPGASAMLTLHRGLSMQAVAAARAEDVPLFLVLRAAGETDVDELNTIGVIAKCIEAVPNPPGGMHVLVRGEARAVATEYRRSTSGFVEATVECARETPPAKPRSATFVALVKELRERATDLMVRHGSEQRPAYNVLAALDRPSALADFVASTLEMRLPHQQALLEELDVEQRLRLVLQHLVKHLHILQAQAELQQHVEEKLGGQQREVFLREQMKMIHKELCDGGGGLAEKLAEIHLPAAARVEVDRELARLDRVHDESLEAQVARTHLEWIAGLPWNIRTEDSVDMVAAARILDDEHRWLADVKDRVLEVLAVHKLRIERNDDTPVRCPILLFVGPPGVGKTSIAGSIARAMGREHVRIALGGVRDQAEIRGHRRTYVGALPGRIINGLRQAGTKNPVFVIDEVDKLGVGVHGDPASALLEVLDPEQNATFTDHYLDVPFDLSEVLFIATGNFEERIPPALRDRMELVRFSGYTDREKVAIAKEFIVPRQIEEAALTDVTFDDAALLTLVREHTHESGVRQLEQRIASIMRKLARQAAAGERVVQRVNHDLVRKLIGRAVVFPECAATDSEIGIATGLYYTATGGDIMFVEASVRRLDLSRTGPPGHVGLVLTGQLGEVMRESARAAVTYAISHAPRWGNSDVASGALEAHIHVPAGAVPKDGPSAGVTVAVALTSALLGLRVRHDVAMTGEITLRGRVLRVAGIKEKVLGAARAAIREVIVPADNLADLEDVPGELHERLRFHVVSSIDEVLDLVLIPDSIEKRRSA